MPYPNPISLPQDQSPGSPSQINDAIRHVNYGNTLAPVQLDGTGIDNSLDLGSATARWRKVYSGGVIVGNPVGSFTVPERRFARYVLPTNASNNISSRFANPSRLLWTIDITLLGKITGAVCNLTLFGDDFNFTTGAGTIIPNAQDLLSRSLNNGYAESVYRTFEIRIVNSTVEIHQWLLDGAGRAGWDDYYSYVDIVQSSNWDGTTQTRGWLDIEYTPYS